MTEQARPSVLVNGWYARPVGHAIEALRRCLGYRAANPRARIALVLNEATPVELASCCRFIDEVYPVPFTDFLDERSDAGAALAGVPRDWDYVVENHRVADPGHQRFAGFRRFYEASGRHFHARVARGRTGRTPPAYTPNLPLRLDIPPSARSSAQRALKDRRAVSVVLAGGSSSRAFYPSASSWRLMLAALSERHPDAVICLIGKLRRDGRSTSAISRAEVDGIAGVCPVVLDCFDRPLLEQLAVVEASDVYISPHTGFGFAAVSVGTPWLALSGGHWHEMFFNGVPFHSVLPDTARYPCFSWGGPLPLIEADTDGEGPRTPSMSAARIREDLPELLDAATSLIERRVPYEQALADYFPRLLAAYKGDRSRIFSFDNVHVDYL